LPAEARDAVEFLRLVSDSDSDNRIAAIDDVKFRYGKQWPDYAITTRGMERPQLTINELDAYIRQVTNSQRQQRPRGKVQPVDDFADTKIAKVIEGIIRHVWANSDADHAVDTAFDWSATIGWGYMRARRDYIAPDSFNQDIFIDVVDNPFSVYADPDSNLPDGSDMTKCLVTDLIKRESFKMLYPGAQLDGFSEQGTGDSIPDWFTDKEIRLAEYFYIDRKPAKLVRLSDGSSMWADEMPAAYLLNRAGIEISATRDSLRNAVKWQKQTGSEILEERDIPGRWIPVIPVYWTSVIIDNKRLRQGMVRPGKDPQRIVNFWKTAVTELIALAPKAKWVIGERALEGHENEFAAANRSPNPVLSYRDIDDNGQPIDRPERMQPEPPPSGAIAAAQLSSQDLQRVMGIHDPETNQTEPKSGRAIRAEQGQGEMSNAHGYDNLTRSIKHCMRIILGWIPSTYDTQRAQRIIGADGRDAMVTLNEKQPGQDETTGEAITKVLNDVTVGTYDVVMEVGPGYETKRQEGVDSMLRLLDTPLGEEVGKVGGDILVREMDFNGADVLADRMAAANPLAQVDESSEIPVQAQMQIQSLQQKLQQATGIIQQQALEIKYRTGIEQMKQTGETQRAHLAATVKAHDSLERSATMAHDTTTRGITAQNVEEIKGIVQLLVKHLDTADLQREIESREASEERQAAMAAQQPVNGNGAAA
jgi:hypothetical protein